MKVAIGFLTKDRVELSEQTIKPLLQPDLYDLFIFDGSSAESGRAFPYKISVEEKYRNIKVHANVIGGPDAAVAYALTTMLKGTDYTHVGLCENDVLLHPDWFGPTYALFERGAHDGLAVGAVSARAYEDRVLIQRDGYAVCHNLGWGQQVLTREAARISLSNMRTSWTTENRRTFMQLAGKDIGSWWAFRHGEHMLCPDWGNDRTLAQHGLASLALTPSPVEMIGQVPPLHEQGLKLVTQPVDVLRDDAAFARYVERTNQVRIGNLRLFHDPFLFDNGNGWIVFAHQVSAFGARYEGDWRLKWFQGFGPFGWKAGESRSEPAVTGTGIAVEDWVNPRITIPLAGPVEFFVSGGPDGGQFELEDLSSGYTVRPVLPPDQIVSLPVPGAISYREIRLTALTPGVVFHAIRIREPQPEVVVRAFDHSFLPPV